MSIFDGFIKNKNNNTSEETEEKREINIFSIIKSLYLLLYNLADRNKLKESIDKIIEDCDENNLNFICWILCHNLCHNKATRQNIDVFVKVSYGMPNIDFIYWYFDFMFVNKIKFPMFMPWYKFGNNNSSKYRESIIVDYNISDEELNDLEQYLNLSDKDIWEDLRYCD